MREQCFRLLQLAEYRFHHAIVQQGGKLLPLGIGQGRCCDIKCQAALKTNHLRQATVMGDIGGFGRPRRNGARARRHQQQAALRSMFSERRAVLEQPLQLGLLFGA
ncbi:hypothetical protein D3C73_895240 [compost metagenome]